MSDQMVLADTSVEYRVKEAIIIAAAIAFVIAVGGIAVASVIICGWRGTSKVVMDWLHGRATFYCR